ncbi:MAG: SpoIIE family protein phosphatase, partial [Deltaproteobacteria bacterium]|nr:SpoIIE family protein phosphatase [Deltaproteobacteria bacterium]
TEDPLLGIQRKEIYHQKSCPLNKGDVVIFYTDGLVESKIKGKKSFGTEGLLKTTKILSDKQAIEIQNGILKTWKDFTKNPIPQDDITLLVLKVT